uniref:GRIP domain-containing protein n=1 Tax=Panagrolaimus sp. JU765 TaxID=591449 RepID=A0AC34QQD5_9BILA
MAVDPEDPPVGFDSENDASSNQSASIPTSNGHVQHQPSKLESLPKEDLIKLLKKQLILVKEARKQTEEFKQQLAEAEKKCTKVEQGAKDYKTEMITLELNDYKNSCAELKKQLENQKESQREKDELLGDLTKRNDALMVEKAELESALKESKNEITRLQKEFNEQKTLINENSKEAQSLTLQSQQIKAECELEIAKLKGQLKRFTDESAEQHKYVAEKTVEIRKLKSEIDTLQRRFDDLQIEHATFKERAEYVLKQKTIDRTESAQSTLSGKHEIDELIKTLQTRNEKISQLNERCSLLEDELDSTREHAKNLKAELEDVHTSLNVFRNRSNEDRRRTESDFEVRLRQALNDNDLLQKQLSRTIETYSTEKERLIESFQRQHVELEAQNKDLNERLAQFREMAVQPPSPSQIAPKKDSKMIQKRVQAQLSKLQPINFSHTGSSSMLENHPGLDHDNDDDDLRSLQEVINDAVEESFNNGLGRPISSLDNMSRPSVDYYTHEDYEMLEKQLVHSRDLLNDMEDTNAKLLEQIKILKEEIRRLERNTEREEHVKNSEYLKNVVMKFLAPPKVNDERQQLLPVLTTILRLSPEEVSNVSKFIKESASRPEEQGGGGWSSLFSGLV